MHADRGGAAVRPGRPLADAHMSAAGAPRIAIVAGESSGDSLGASLIAALRERRPEIRVEGMAGPAMRAAGCEALADVSELSVMGLVEVASKYRSLRRLRARLRDRFLASPPDAFVGIDVPDFNLGLAGRLKAAGIPTAQLVCPQVWAWRQGRARRIARDVDRLLALLPFEPAFFERWGVPTRFIGHPLADALPLEPDRGGARAALGLPSEATVVAILPGSRAQEVERLVEPFVAGVAALRVSRPDLQAVLCLARDAHAARAREALAQAGGGLDCRIVTGQSAPALGAADVALVASGTATLEGLLCRAPMVVGYRLAGPTYHIIRRMVSIPHIAMPNILAGTEIVPELIQNELTPPAIAGALDGWLEDGARRVAYVEQAHRIHESLRRGAAGNAADAVLELAGR